jgi:hypothetical protein
LLDVLLIRTWLCDVALNDVLYGNHQDFHVLVANKGQIVFGGLCLLANGIACPLLLIFFSMVSFKMPNAVDFSVRRGVDGCVLL